MQGTMGWAAWPLVVLGGVGIAADSPGPSDKGPTAEGLMVAAHRARSSWDASFPGFSARMSAVVDSKRAQGTVTVTKGDEVKVTLESGDPEVADWATKQLESIVMHRRGNAQDHYDVSFADEDRNHPLGRLIRFHGGSTHSLYRIDGDVITEVHRELGHARFTISVTQIARNPEGKTIPRHFNVSFWDPKTGQLQANEDYQEEWVRIGEYDLPARRLLIRTAPNVRNVSELRLTDHRLTPPAP